MLESELNVEGIDLELIDLYDKNGELVRRAVPKGEKKHAGEYAKHVLIIMKTSDSPAPGEDEGQYVVQQRSLKAKYYAGKWDMTGGGVKSGEEPVDAACREVREELGIALKPEDMELAFKHAVTWDDGTGLLVYVFMCRVQVPEGGFEFDRYEVNDVKVMPFHEFLEHVMDHNSEEFGEGLKEIERRL
ncbi:NUDIX domain-containing protein [Butyrivibrio proteoclasticus]|uniref:NUDIX domain-containing protein n=1 Tax=Butyrivibrio proteoclasticus TaxID=43305 RepID=UPI00047C7033|nr:NUDIX domain-containing protein [Butyrivibrio proteoclasticus]